MPDRAVEELEEPPPLNTHTKEEDPDDPLPKWLRQWMDRERKSDKPHRSRDSVPVFPACVARPVSKKELNATPKAIEARVKEWNNGANKRTWNLKSVREWRDVAREART